MRSFGDRLRHAISFEIIGLLIVAPLGALVFGKPMVDIGAVGVVSAVIAATWVFVYNAGFDHAMQRLRGTTQKGLLLRIAHAVLFEVGLVAMLMPFIAFYLGVTLWEALMMDLSLSAFYLVYAFSFNWAYDRLFPLPEWRTV